MNGTECAPAADEIIGRLTRGIRESERAVLELGAAVDQIVRLATGADTGAGGSGAELPVAQRLDAVTAAAAGFVEQTRAFLRRQVEFARAANGAFRHIYKTATGVTDLTAKSRLLALNLQIEAVRSGDQGALRVIGQEMVQFSQDIRGANGAIVAALDGLSQSLPQIEAEAIGMDDRANGFATDLAKQLQAVQADVADLRDAQAETEYRTAERNREIVAQANRALSELQFHDPLSQDLRAVMRLLGAPLDENEAPIPLSAFGDNDPTRVAGELDLF